MFAQKTVRFLFARGAQGESVTHGGVGDDFVLDQQVDPCRVVVLGHDEPVAPRSYCQAGLVGEFFA
ncbi:hypothetical protein D3C72_2147350 [compost metagenome]